LAAVVTEGADYPAHREADVVLRDGRTCHIRPLRPEDADLLVEFHSRLSPETIYFRFFAPYPTLSARDVERFTHVDHVDRVALAATMAGEIVGVGRYDRIDTNSAEVAFSIRDDQQGRGLGSILLEHLAVAARENGVSHFVGEVLPNNARMIATFLEAGYQAERETVDGVVHFVLDIEPTESSLAVMAAREHRAEARSVARLLAPSSVAVIGASRKPGTIGHELVRHILAAGFVGPVYAIHPEAEQIAGVPAFPSVLDAPGSIDLAVVAVPAAAVEAVVGDCAAAGVRGLIVISGGFAETGPEGRDRQRRLVATAREHGMRVVGPNCLGIINTDPSVRLNASLSPTTPKRGRTAFFSQSGALGTAILDNIGRRGLGLSTFVSAGNRADISANDLLQYWEEDEATDLVLLYLESIGNPRKFTRIARRMSMNKPVIAVKSGRSTRWNPLGHAVRESALPTAAIEAIFSQSGVIQTDTLNELFDVASVLSTQPLPTGRRVAVIGNSDALAVLALDACATWGLDVAGAPLTLGVDATPEALGRGLAAIVEDPAADAILVVHVPPLQSDATAYERVIAATAARSAKPVLAILIASSETSLLQGDPEAVGPASEGVPVFTSVEDAVYALSLISHYAAWRSRSRGEFPELDRIDPEAARAVIADHLGGDAGPVLLDQGESTRLLACYGIDVWPWVDVGSAREAVAAAKRVGYPVALKTRARALAHRIDLGGVRLDLGSTTAVRAAYDSMVGTLGSEAAQSLVVQKMAEPGVAVVVGSREDPLFGPVVTFGLAGVIPELLGDRGYRIPPLTDADARELIRAPGASPMLTGHRGSEPVNLAALEELLLRVGQLADEHPEIGELVLDPVIATRHGLAILDASVTLTNPDVRTDPGARRLLN